MIDLAILQSLANGRVSGVTLCSSASRRVCRRSLPASCALAVLACVSAPLLAQDPFGTSDPFSAPADPAAKPAPQATTPVPSPTNAPAVAEDPDPLIRLLRSVPPKTPQQFADAIEWMVRIQRWDEVGRYLDLVQNAAWSRDELAEFSRAGGADLWYRLRDAGSELSVAQLKFVNEVAALPAQLARDPKWIDSWINRLAAESAAERREAQMRLQQANRAAIERLCARLLAGDPQVPGVRLVDSLLEFNLDGIEALRAACVASDAQARARVLLALAQSTATEFGVELGSALESDRLPEAARQTISQALLKKYGKLPAAAAVRDYMVTKFERQLEEYNLMRSHSARLPVKVWRLAADGLTVTSVETIAADRSLELLAQIAAHRIGYRLRTHEDLIDCATALMQRAYQSQPGVATADPTGLVLMGLPDEAQGSDFWKQVLDRSQTWQMHGASIRAAQAIGKELVRSPAGSASFDFIAACLRDSRPVMRYVAVDAIARANVQEEYNGSSSALETAIEMSRLGQGPMVLVVGLTAELRAIAETQLSAIGAPSLSVNSTQAALRILDQPFPIEMIMIVDRVPRNSLLVLVERLRHARRGASLPIAVLTDQLERFEETELSRYPGVVMSVLSNEPDHMSHVIGELERHLDVRPLNAVERAEFAGTANVLLATIAADRQRYEFYPLARWEDELRSVSDALPTSIWLTVLGGMGTTDSQAQLAAIAGDEGRTSETRAQAAAAFARSIKQFGLLLSRAAINKAYDVYNIQGPNDPVTVSALGQVLDAIETKTGSAESLSAP